MNHTLESVITCLSGIDTFANAISFQTNTTDVLAYAQSFSFDTGFPGKRPSLTGAKTSLDAFNNFCSVLAKNTKTHPRHVPKSCSYDVVDMMATNYEWVRRQYDPLTVKFIEALDNNKRHFCESVVRNEANMYTSLLLGSRRSCRSACMCPKEEPVGSEIATCFDVISYPEFCKKFARSVPHVCDKCKELYFMTDNQFLFLPNILVVSIEPDEDFVPYDTGYMKTKTHMSFTFGKMHINYRLVAMSIRFGCGTYGSCVLREGVWRLFTPYVRNKLSQDPFTEGVVELLFYSQI